MSDHPPGSAERGRRRDHGPKRPAQSKALAIAIVSLIAAGGAAVMFGGARAVADSNSASSHDKLAPFDNVILAACRT